MYRCLSSARKGRTRRYPGYPKSDCVRQKVIASVHPAYLARYGWNSIGDLEKYLQKMGFWQAFDAAQGAAVMKEEYTRLLREQQQKNW